MRFIHKSNYFFVLDRIFFSASKRKTVKQNNQSHDAITSRWHDVHILSKWDVSSFLISLFDNRLLVLVYRLSNCAISKWMYCNLKWQLNFGSCNFGLKSYFAISNRTRASRSLDFETTRMISGQISLHSVELPSFKRAILYAKTLISFSDRFLDLSLKFNLLYQLLRALSLVSLEDVRTLLYGPLICCSCWQNVSWFINMCLWKSKA